MYQLSNPFTFPFHCVPELGVTATSAAVGTDSDREISFQKLYDALLSGLRNISTAQKTRSVTPISSVPSTTERNEEPKYVGGFMISSHSEDGESAGNIKSNNGVSQSTDDTESAVRGVLNILKNGFVKNDGFKKFYSEFIKHVELL